MMMMMKVSLLLLSCVVASGFVAAEPHVTSTVARSRRTSDLSSTSVQPILYPNGRRVAQQQRRKSIQEADFNSISLYFPHQISAVVESPTAETVQVLEEQQAKTAIKSKPSFSLLDTYSRWLDEFPLRTKSGSAGFVCGLGSLLSQILCRSVTASSASTATTASATMASMSISWHQVAIFTLLGVLFKGPYYHYWFRALDRITNSVSNRLQQTKLKIPPFFLQLGLDQTLGVAIFYPAYFYAYEIVLSGLSLQFPQLSRVNALVRSELLKVIAAQYALWPAVQAINFGFVPEKLRVLWVNLAAVIWNCYFCLRLTA